MASQKVHPDPSVLEQHRRSRQNRDRQRRLSVLAVVGVIVVGVIAAAMALDDSSPALDTRGGGAVASVPEGDVLLVDVVTGQKRSGPELGVTVDHVAVSPDGTKVAYISFEPGGPEIVFVADIDGSNVRAYPATRSPGAARTPAWSPDGSTIVYQRMGNDSRIGGLFLLDVASGKVQPLIHLGHGLGLVGPTFDPSGDSVLYTAPTSTDPPHLHMWAVPVEDGDPSLILRNVIVGDASSSAAKITFVRTRIVGGEVTGADLWIADADGSHARRIVVGPVSLSRWSPDGTRVLFADELLNSLKVLDLSSGETTLMPSQADGADWLANGTLMIDGSPES